MVPAESIMNFESRPLFFTRSLNTPSAAGLLQMFPKHTKSTEKGFVAVSELVGRAVSAMEATMKEVDGVEKWVPRELRGGLKFRRWENFIG